MDDFNKTIQQKNMVVHVKKDDKITRKKSESIKRRLSFKRDLQKYTSEQIDELPPLKKRKISENIVTSEHFHILSEKNNNDSNLSFLKDRVFFINNEKEKQTVLERYRKDREIGSVIKIFSSEDILENDLFTTKKYLNGKIEKSTGRLFTDEYITLIFDFTQINPSEIAGLNDLLEIPATFEGQKLSQSVNRIILVSKDMLTLHSGVLGSDFWRRVQMIISSNGYEASNTNRFLSDSSKQIIGDVLSDQDFLLSKVHDADINNEAFLNRSKKIIDFSEIGREWRLALTGDLYFNEKRKIEYKESQLANLSSGDCIVLHDAPWEDRKFVNVLATILRENGYYSNGNIIVLPDNIQFFKTHTSVDEVEKLKKKWIDSQEHQISTDLSSVVVLNRQLFQEILSSTTQINEHGYRPINPIIELLQNCTTLFITNQLTDQQWLYLLREIDRQKKEIKIIFDEEKIPFFHQKQNVQCHIYSHEEDVLHFFKESYDIYQINAEDQWSALWTKTHIISYQNLLVEQEKTTLLEALMYGKPIVLYGLENNPIITAQLETLLTNPSYLFIQGRKITLPKINLIILCHEKKKDQMIQQSLLWKQAFHKTEIENNDIEMEDIANTEEMERIFTLIKAIPAMKGYTICFPWKSRNFAKLLEKQIEIEKKQDGSNDALPYHRRKALYTLLVKNYRANENVVGYLKAHIQNIYPDSEDSQANKTALKQWIDQHPCINQQILKENFWSLVRHCPAQLFHLSLNYDNIDDRSFYLLSFYLIGSVSGEKRENLAKQLNIPIDHAASDDQYYDGKIRKCLYDALFIAGCEHRIVKQAISTLAQKLEKRISSILASDTDTTEKILAIQSELQRVFANAILEKDFKDLSLEIFYGDKVHLYQQKRRLKKLANHLELHLMIFLQGVAGAGKSHIAQAVVSELQKKEQWQNMPPPMVLSLGPETTKEFLYGGETFVETNDGDKKSEWQAGHILQWAMNPNPPLLILDEANLVKKGVLAPLAGLTMDHPQLSIDGHIYKIPDPHRHRIILTGNPNSYSGRAMDSTIQEKLITFYCRPLSKEVLAECVIEPALPEQYSKEEKKYMKEMILFLFEKYRQLLPNDLSPRDLHDVIASIHHILQDITEKTITHKEIHSLVWTSFEEAFATNISKAKRPAFIALKHWYLHHYLLDDSILKTRQQKFDQFFIKLKYFNPSLSTETKQIYQLIYHYWLFLEKQEIFHKQKRGLIIEGPAGWGKDFILKTVLMQWQKEYSQKESLFINANPYHWTDHVQKIKQAMIDGKKVVISEMNILPSSHIEGLFNEILTGSFHKGFALIATMNPSSFSGREKISSALKNRCQQIKLHTLTKEEISKIVANNTQDALLHSWFTPRYYILSKKLQEFQASLQLTRNDLSGFLKKLLINNTPQKNWGSEFESYYTLFLQSLFLNMEKFEEILKKEIEEIEEIEEILKSQQELSLWIHRFCNKPVIVKMLSKKNTDPFYNKSTLTLTLPYIKDKEQLQKIANMALTFPKEAYINTNVDPIYDITKIQERDFTRYFNSNKFRPKDYRLQVIEYDYDGNIIIVPCTAGGIEIIEPRFSSIEQVENSENYQKGMISLTVTSDSWKELPGISSDDRLIAIDCEENDPIIIGRGMQTGQLLVKLKSTQKVIPAIKNVNIIFIIEPNENALNLYSIDDIQIDESLCSSLVKDYFNQHVFSEDARFFFSCWQLQEIKKEKNNLTKIHELLKWTNEFSTTDNLIGDGLDYVRNIIYFKQGVCRHRALVFYFISQYFGIPARIIRNYFHNFIEVSLDGQKTWRKIEMKGGVNYILHENPNTFNKNKNKKIINIDVSKFSELLYFLSNEEVDFFVKQEIWDALIKKESGDRLFEICIELCCKLNNTLFFEKALEEIKKTLKYLKLSNANLLHYFVDRFEVIFNKNNDIFFFLSSCFVLWKKNIIGDEIDSHEKKFFLFYIGKLLIKIDQLFQDNKIKKNDYYEFIIKISILINNINIYLVFNILQKIIKQDGFKYKREIEVLLKYFCKKLYQNKSMSFFKYEPYDISSIKGESKTLINSLKKNKMTKQWSDVNFNGCFNITRFLERKKPFCINSMTQRDICVLLPHHFSTGGNIYNFLQGLVGVFIKEKVLNVNLLDLTNNVLFYHEVASGFISYFLEKTQENLLIICFSEIYTRDDGENKLVYIPLGTYKLFENSQRLLQYYSFLSSFYNYNRYKIDFDIPSDYEIKCKEKNNLSLFVTSDFLKKCFLEYLNTIDVDALSKSLVV